MTNKAVPKASDFPSVLRPVLSAPLDGKIANVVLFLPGLGDTSTNFSGFARALNLPESLCITLQPPSPLPLPLPQGFHWGDDVIFDQSTASLEPDAGFSKAGKLIADNVLKGILVEKCGFSYREILVFGYGQGGMTALAVAVQVEESLGGVLSIGGSIPSSCMIVNRRKSRTPVLLLGGKGGVLARDDRNGIKKVQGSFEFVEYHQWDKPDDGMPKNRDEAFPLMQFFARRLRSLKGVPSGAVEIS